MNPVAEHLTTFEKNRDDVENHSIETYQDLYLESFTRGGTLLLRVWKGERAQKPRAFYRYDSEEKRTEAIDRFKKDADERIEEKDKMRALKAQSPDFEVGDVFVDSWGYDQTNIDFYQCVKKSSKHYGIFHRIGGEKVERNGKFIDRVKPCKDDFSKSHEEFRGKVSFLLNADGTKSTHYISIGHHTAFKTSWEDTHYETDPNNWR